MANTKVPIEFVDLDSGIVINEGSADVDFRIESDDSTHMLFVDAGNDRVGIKQSSPLYELDVNGEAYIRTRLFAGDGSASNASIRFYNASSGLYHAGSDALGFTASGSERMRIDASGNVGIGRTPSNYSGLSFSAPITDIAGILQTRGGGINIGGSGYRKAGIFTPTSDGDAGNLQFYVAASGSDSSVTEVMRITASGTSITNTGGGTTSANYLKVEGATANNSNYPAIELKGGTLANVYPSYGITNGGLGTWITAGYHTSNYNSRAALSVNNGTVGMYVSSGSSYTHAFNLTNGGNLSITGTLSEGQSLSDSRLKENITVIPDAIDKVKTLQGVTFTRKNDGSEGTGLIAEELEKVLPQAVYETTLLGEKDYKTDVLDEENTTKYKAIRYGITVGLLVQAIKEQQTIIEDLKARIETLEG